MSYESQDIEQEILSTLFRFLARFPSKAEKLTAQTSLTADLTLDSVSMMELLVEIEDHFDVGMPLNAMANVHTVQDLADQIKSLLENRS
ncbi:MAG: phosphopantetheine-binding protein [Rhodobacteraceae bacterium CG17_big_fil_post_rev_8_21_14_2_50_63_15]|nr:MAG: phosphopantetheine-binding protein [Rhodobacteraceae bacterium CG17_big_fil_post_rev_8_21_14_2_50_63_15]